MTKIRAPLSFAKAIKHVSTVVPFARMVEMFTLTDRAVRYWSEDDTGGMPTLAQAFALDAAYRAAGGQGAPILESYAAQLAAIETDEATCCLALAAAIGAAAQEFGEAVNHALVVTAPGATLAQVRRALSETEEAHGCTGRLIRYLKKFLPAVGVVSGSMRVTT